MNAKFYCSIAFIQSEGVQANRSLELDLVDGLVEGLALDRGDLELECGRLARAIGGGEGTSSPRRSTVRLGEVGDLAEGLCVAEGNEDYRCIMRSGY